ncbi:uncharacterized protein TNCV_1665831 [Trichonephila clavipes]|nr:uncharacterized protein TNCV_1665831 [Trichonephila clavipes]
MDLEISNDGQEKKKSPQFHTIPTAGHLSFDIYNVHRSPLHSGSSTVISVLQSVLCRLSKRSSTIANMENGGHSRVCVIRIYQKTVPFSPSKKTHSESKWRQSRWVSDFEPQSSDENVTRANIPIFKLQHHANRNFRPDRYIAASKPFERYLKGTAEFDRKIQKDDNRQHMDDEWGRKPCLVGKNCGNSSRQEDDEPNERGTSRVGVE